MKWDKYEGGEKEKLPLLRHTWRTFIFAPRKPEESPPEETELLPQSVPAPPFLFSSQLSISCSDDPLALSLISLLSALQDFILFRQNNASDLRFFILDRIRRYPYYMLSILKIGIYQKD